MAAFAEHEAHAISERPLAALKARGVKLGNPRWRESLEKARQTRIEQTRRPNGAVVEMIQQMRLKSESLRAIAYRLNELGVRTPRGCHCYASTVRALLRQAEL